MTVRNPQFSLYLPRTVLAWQAVGPGDRVLELEGTLLFADLTGFTALVERKAAEGREGAEEVTGTLNRVFTDLLSVAHEEGGDVLKFGGDAFLVLFTGEASESRAALAALDMQDVLADLALPGIGMSMGLETGPIQLHLCGGSYLEAMVLGEAVVGALSAEKEASAGEVRVAPRARQALAAYTDGGSRLVDAPSSSISAEHPVPEPPDGFDLADFIPSGLGGHMSVGGSQGEHRRAAIGFLHLEVPPGLTAPAVHERLAPAMEAIDATAARHETTVLGSDVDAAGVKVILAAGVPTATRREEERVLRTLHRVLEQVEGLPVRGGVARGAVFAADLGAPFRRTYTVIGDTVNLAARLMAAAEPGQLLTTAKTIERSPTRFRTTRLAPVSLKGKSKPLTPLAVGPIIGVEESSRLDVPLVGRDQEMATLRAAIAAVRDGRGGVVELVGEAGIGKTRLLREAQELAGTLDSYVLVCEQYETNTAYYVAGHLIRGVLGLQPDSTPEQVTARLVEAVSSHAPQLHEWLPLLGIPLNLHLEETPATRDLAPSFRLPRLEQVLEELLAAVLVGPAVFVVEDAHWMDAASADLLQAVGEASTRRPWLTLVGRRSGGAWASPPHAQVLILEPLADNATSQLLRLASRAHPVSDRDLDLLANRAGGHPLFALELLEGFGHGDLPDSVEAVIAERIDRLDPRDRQLLRFASVLGSSFTLDLLAEALPSVAPSLEDSETWERLRDFIEISTFGTVVFRHDLIRAAAYEGLSYRSRRDVHGIVAEALERRARRRPERYASLLALHHYLAENWVEAWRFSRMAAEAASSQLAPADATEWYVRALEAADRLDGLPAQELLRVSEELGDAASLAGKPALALSAYERAEALAAAGSIDVPRLLRKKGAHQIKQGDYATALGWLEQGLELIDGIDGPEAGIERVELMLALAGTLNRQGRYAECAVWCDKALAEAHRVGHRPGIAHADFLIVLTDLALGRDGDRERGLEALQIYEELGDLVGQGNVWNNLGMRSYYRGDWGSSIDEWEKSRDCRRRAGDASGAAVSVNNLGEVLSDRGQLDEAEEMFRDALRAFEAAGFPTGVALATSNLGRVESRRGRLQEAVELLDRAEKMFTDLGAASFVAETRFRMAEARAMAGEYAEAVRLLDDVGASGEVPGLEAAVERIRAVAAHAAGDVVAAEAALRHSIDLAEQADVPYELALSLDLAGRLFTDHDALERARGMLLGLGADKATRLPLP